MTPCQLGHLTLEDYQIWSVKSALANEFLNLLFQVSIATLHTVVIKLTLIFKVFLFKIIFCAFVCVFFLVQVCHIVLGLRPGTPEEEGQIIRHVPVHFVCHVIVYNFEYAVGANKCFHLICVCVCVFV